MLAAVTTMSDERHGQDDAPVEGLEIKPVPRGRPKDDEEREELKLKAFRVTPRQAAFIKSLAKSQGVNQSDIVRAAIDLLERQVSGD